MAATLKNAMRGHPAAQSTHLCALALCLLLAACGSGPTSPSSTTERPTTSGPQQSPSLSGTWRGSYFIVGEPSGSDGVMSWVVQQSGNTLAGTFTIQRDTVFGNVTGSLNGSFAPAAGTTPNHYTVTLGSGSISEFSGCTMVLTAREFSITSAPTQLNGTYKQSLCGFSSNLENGVYQLRKQ